MVFSNTIKLYSTPLDSNYENVYDGYSTHAQYIDFLDNNFGVITITGIGIKSRKNIGDNFEITISGYNSYDLHDYNYMYFNNGYDDVFAFILRVDSENDGSTSKSCKLICKLDAWTNHLGSLKGKVEEERCTLDTNIWYNYPTDLKTKKFSENVSFHNVISNASGSYNTDENLIIPVWQRITTVEPFKLYRQNTNQENEQNIDTYWNLCGFPVVYNLVGAYTLRVDEKTLRMYKGAIHLNFYAKVNGTYNYLTKDIASFSNSIFEVYSSKAIGNTLVTNVPFKYTISYSSGAISINIPIDYYFDYGSKATCNGITLFEDASKMTNAISPTVNSSGTAYSTYSVATVLKREIYDSSKRYSYEYVGDNEQIKYEYPLNYYSLFIKGKKIPVIGAQGESTSLSCGIDCDKKMTANLSFRTLIDRSTIIPLESDRELPILNVTYDEYMLRNGNEMRMKLTSNLISGISSVGEGIISVASGNPLGAASIVGGSADAIGKGLSYNAHISDLQNAGSFVLDRGTNAFSTPILDTVFVMKHSAYNIEKIIEDYHNNGYECFYISELTEKRRDIFDVDKGTLKLYCRMGDSDRKELIEAVKRGITRWHILGKDEIEPSNKRVSALRLMNKNVYNYSYSLIPTP